MLTENKEAEQLPDAVDIRKSPTCKNCGVDKGWFDTQYKWGVFLSCNTDGTDAAHKWVNDA